MCTKQQESDKTTTLLLLYPPMLSLYTGKLIHIRQYTSKLGIINISRKYVILEKFEI